MPYHRREIPVSAYVCRVRIIGSEHTVIYPVYPYVILILLPSHGRLCPGDLCAKRLFTAVNNACVLKAGAYRIDGLSVYPRRNNDFIPWSSRLRSVVDILKRSLFPAVSLSGCGATYINLHFCIPPASKFVPSFYHFFISHVCTNPMIFAQIRLKNYRFLSCRFTLLRR